MTIDLTKLIQNIDNSIVFNEIINFDIDVLNKAGIKSMNPVNVKGEITKNDISIYHINLNIKGVMILPCSLTLVDVEYKFDINYDEDINEDDENLKIVGNYLDIIPIVWENIVTEIPLKVISTNAKLKMMENENFKIIESEEKVEKGLEQLKNLLKEKEDE
jgi:uncharacterized protein